MAKQKQRDFLFDGAEETVSEVKDAAANADHLMDVLMEAGAQECASENKCATCLHPCADAKAAPLPAVADHEAATAVALIAINDAMGKARRPNGEKFRNTEAMSAGANLVSALAGAHLKNECEGVERMMLKIQTAAAFQQLGMALRVLAKQNISGIPVVLAMAKLLDTSVRLCSKSIHQELVEFNEREGKKQA
jgi:hypothetical protein